MDVAPLLAQQLGEHTAHVVVVVVVEDAPLAPWPGAGHEVVRGEDLGAGVVEEHGALGVEKDRPVADRVEVHAGESPVPS